MQPSERKTAVCFHATDDCPEVRREVFRLLMKQPQKLRFFAIVARKLAQVDYVRQQQRVDSTFRYTKHTLYDFLVHRFACAGLLHKHESCEIRFARRFERDRNRALAAALEGAFAGFQERRKLASSVQLHVQSGLSAEYPALQATDYFLWALQRMYEKQEDRYWEYVWPSVRLIVDHDDRRQAPSGMHYSQKKPLTLAALEG